MRPAVSVCLVLALGACNGTEPDADVIPVEVQWMEWPAEVLAATPFTARLTGYGVSCQEVLKFDPAPRVDNSAVTFEPFYLVTGEPGPCPLRDYGAGQGVPQAGHPISILVPMFDTRASVPGLEAQNPRLYEMRAAASVYAREGGAAPALPVRTFGDITVRSDVASAARTNAGGNGYAYRESPGCVRLSAAGVYPGYIVENPPDTASYWYGFVRGYLYEPAAKLCGESRVFRVVSIC